ncbi:MULTISPECIES: DUF6879 family protein [Streptomyces]|uniref:DUF6879 domain-containing protein n=2 Tax=Streptomyces TaxID=1883 RepID=Q9KZT3_STRCO|nr:hypothetical protein [Streptomyces sp. SID7813]QFI42968.1 hypothetical protein FQ762_14705 [Streptomyces coelicolor A3(2)]THA81785.1 hypothetical protein E6R61_35560 [Streptomyces sp. LRa12]CAB88809.1 conserved hypothetical protein [Streptomyces coelicolor A3(2)]
MRSAQRSAHHLEMRDAYDLDADYREWSEGNLFDPSERWPWWIELVSSTVARGVAVQRARIVSEPLSSYTRYEYELTGGHNVKAGEDVRWLPRRQSSDLALPGNDFWLFDGVTVLFNHFAGDGTMTGEELVTDQSVVGLCSSAFSAVWERAIPHQEYRPA